MKRMLESYLTYLEINFTKVDLNTDLYYYTQAPRISLAIEESNKFLK